MGTTLTVTTPAFPFWMMPEKVRVTPGGAAMRKAARAYGELLVMMPVPVGAGHWVVLSSPLRSKVPPVMVRLLSR